MPQVSGSGDASLNAPMPSLRTDTDVGHFIVSYRSSVADDACPLSDPSCAAIGSATAMPVQRSAALLLAAGTYADLKTLPQAHRVA